MTPLPTLLGTRVSVRLFYKFKHRYYTAPEILYIYIYIYIYIYLCVCVPGSSVSIANHCGDVIFRPSRPALGPTQPPLQWVPRLSRG